MRSRTQGAYSLSLGGYEFGKIKWSVVWAFVTMLLYVGATAILDQLADLTPAMRDSQVWWHTALYPTLAVMLTTARQWLKDNSDKYT